MQEVKQLLRFCFGLKTTDVNYIPSAVEVLKYSDAFPVKELLKRLKPFEEQAPGSGNFSWSADLKSFSRHLSTMQSQTAEL